jgi:hypothetical protein
MTLIVSSSEIDVNVSTVFSLNISAIGLLGKFPSDLVDNSEFNYIGLDAEGSVRDNDVADLDPDNNEIAIEYSIVAPEVSGIYTLQFFIATHTPYSNSTYISVYVTDPSVSSSIPTSPSSSTPTSPSSPPPDWWNYLANIMATNFFVMWGVLLLLLLVPAAIKLRKRLINRVLLTGVFMETFGWAVYYMNGHVDLFSGSIVIIGTIVIIYAGIKLNLEMQDSEATD